MATDKVLVPNQLSFDSAMELFGTPASNIGVAEWRELSFKPQNLYDGKSVIRFHVPNIGSQYLWLPSTRLEVTSRIVQGNNEELPPNPDLTDDDEELSAEDKKKANIASVGVVNAYGDSMWDMVECFANDTLISSGNTGYAYKAMMNLLLNYSDADKKTKLQSHCFYSDTPGFMNSVNNTSSGGNEGLIARSKLTAESKPITTVTNLFSDLFMIQKYLLNGVSLNINLYPTTTEFRLLSGNDEPNYKIEILDVTLWVAHVTPSTQVLLAHQEILRSNTRARYPFIRQELRKFIIPAGNISFFAENVFNGVCPDKMIMALVSSDACAGKYTKNPFDFKHYNLNFVSISQGGVPSPKGPSKLNFEKGQFGPYFNELFKTTGTGNSEVVDFSNGITQHAFANGYSLLITDLSPQSKMGSFFPLKREGSVRMELQFSQPLPETVILLCLVFAPDMFSIDFARNVFLGE
jgi:hypothetical protein